MDVRQSVGSAVRPMRKKMGQMQDAGQKRQRAERESDHEAN
jgi:Sec-independent protein translocase protein TatA